MRVSCAVCGDRVCFDFHNAFSVLIYFPWKFLTIHEHGIGFHGTESFLFISIASDLEADDYRVVQKNHTHSHL